MGKDAVAKISADAIKGSGLIEAVSLSKVLASGDNSVLLFAGQLDKPLSNEEIERMLSNQAIILNSIGNRKIQHSVDILLHGGSLDASDRLLKNGFKAMELSRKFLTALNEVRNPKKSTTFIKNAIAQQVNQLVTTSPNHQQDSLGESDAPQVDFRAETQTKGVDSELATLDKIDRSAKRCRKATG